MSEVPLHQAASEVLGLLAQPTSRHPVIRTGQREPITGRVRSLVYRRDGSRCVWCGSARNLCLDHIVPWSAGGSDEASNLRTLCWDCNDDRSNYALPLDDMSRRMSVVWTCVPCGLGKDEQPPDIDRAQAYCGRCGLTSWTYAGCEQ